MKPPRSQLGFSNRPLQATFHLPNHKRAPASHSAQSKSAGRESRPPRLVECLSGQRFESLCCSAISSVNCSSCRCNAAPPSSRLAAVALEVNNGVAGTLLAFPGVGKETMHIMSTRGGQRVFDAPDFPEHQIASTFGCRFFHCLDHIILPGVLPACKSPEVHGLAFPPADEAAPRWRRWRCADNSTLAIYPCRECWRGICARRRRRRWLEATLIVEPWRRAILR